MKNLIISFAILVFVFQLLPMCNEFYKVATEVQRDSYINQEVKRTEKYFYKEGLKKGLNEEDAKVYGNKFGNIIQQRNKI